MKLFPFLLLGLSLWTCAKDLPLRYDESQQSILHGTQVLPTEHRAVVYIESASTFCTGILVSQRLVLTAANCFVGQDPLDLQVYFTSELGVDPSSVSRPVMDIYPHPSFDETQFELGNDIALLELEIPAPEYVEPLPLLPPAEDLTESDITNTTILTYVGFGFVEGSTPENYGKRYATTVLDYLCDDPGGCEIELGGILYGMPQNSMASETHNSDSLYPGFCSGDMGGPVLMERNGTVYVAGVASFSYLNTQGLCDFLSVATRVPALTDFFDYYLPYDEDCDNGIDDNQDGDVDCWDFLCDMHTLCMPRACDLPTSIACGDTLTGSTFDGYLAYELYPQNCTGGIALTGGELAYTLDASERAIVTVQVTPDESDGDMDLILLKGECDKTACHNASMNDAGQTESLSFVMDDQAHFLLVDTYRNPGGYTISITCDSTEVPVNEICDNQIDDDSNGFVDCADEACENHASCQTVIDPHELCHNGLDDDNDGLTDCADADCQEFLNCAEVQEECSNQIDDDGDFHIDCADADCAASLACDRTGIEICNNEVGDNQDGLVDCDDPFCRSSRHCPLPFEICGNYQDDDQDDLVDCDDPDCQSYEACGPISGEICNNVVDDNGDGLADCDDPQCASFSFCEYLNPPSPPEETPTEDSSSCSCQFPTRGSFPSVPPLFFLLIGMFLIRGSIPKGQ